MGLVLYGVTNAFFGNTEKSVGNAFIAGAIDLKVDNECHYNEMVCVNGLWDGPVGGYPVAGTACTCTWSTPEDLKGKAIFNFTDIKPGDDGEDTISLHVDTNPAWVCAEISNVAQNDNGCNPPELKAEQAAYGGVGKETCDDPGPGQGELWGVLKFSLWMDNGAGDHHACNNIKDEDETYLVENAPATDLKYPIADSQNGKVPIQNACIGVSWSVPDSIGNIIQSDSVTGDITFNAYQARHNDKFVCFPPRTGTVTVNKVVINNNGGGADDGDFKLYVGGTPVTDEVPQEFAPGNYTVTEDQFTGYSATFSGNCDANGNITVVAGNSYTCTITNDDLGTTLRIVKTVVNDGGGTKQVGDFVLKIDGNQVTNDTPVAVSTGNHTASEDPMGNYVASDWGGACSTNGAVSLALGENKTCTITNTFSCFSQADVMLVLDRSQSIDTGERTQLKAAAHSFVTALNPDGGVHMGQSSFSDTGSLDQHLTNNQPAINAAIDALGDGTYTNLYQGLDLANSELDNSNTLYERPAVPDFMIVITDGNPNRPTPDATARSMAVTEADAARLAGVSIYVVGVGSDVDANYLRTEIADDAAYYFGIADYEALEMALMNIAYCGNPPIGTLRVTKVIVGGSLNATNFSFQVNGGTATAFEADGSNDVSVLAGTYSVTEPAVNYYITTYSNCTNVVVSDDETETCTITNTYNPPLFSDNFNDGDYIGWSSAYFGDNGGTISDDIAVLSNSTSYEGYSVRLEDDVAIYQNVSTVGKTNIQLKYCRRTQSVSGSDRLRIGWKTGAVSSTWADYTQLEAVSSSTWTCMTQNLPASADNSSISIAFFLDNGEGDYGWVDNVEVLGI